MYQLLILSRRLFLFEKNYFAVRKFCKNFRDLFKISCSSSSSAVGKLGFYHFSIFYFLFLFCLYSKFMFPLGLTKAACYCCVVSGMDPSWLEHGLSVRWLPVAWWSRELWPGCPGLWVSCFWMMWAHIWKLQSVLPVPGLRGRKWSLRRMKSSLLLLIGGYIKNCDFFAHSKCLIFKAKHKGGKGKF